MKYWLLLQGWFWRVTPSWLHGPMTWVGHGLVAGLIALPFALAGQGKIGFTAGVSAYAFREFCEVLARGWGAQWWDHIGDVIGPIIGAGLIWKLI